MQTTVLSFGNFVNIDTLCLCQFASGIDVEL